MQRNFGLLQPQVEEWQALPLSTAAVKPLIDQTLIEDEVRFPKHLARRLHESCFEPVPDGFELRTRWSLPKAF